MGKITYTLYQISNIIYCCNIIDQQGDWKSIHFLFQLTTSLALVHADKGQTCISLCRRNGLLCGNFVYDALSRILIHLGIQLENDKNYGDMHVPVILCLCSRVTWISIWLYRLSHRSWSTSRGNASNTWPIKYYYVKGIFVLKFMYDVIIFFQIS